MSIKLITFLQRIIFRLIGGIGGIGSILKKMIVRRPLVRCDADWWTEKMDQSNRVICPACVRPW
jgi:hypothetical protein